MRAIFGTPKDPSTDRNKVKEADTIKVPAFPHAESYRKWRIRTRREAVMSASTDPDKAFDWMSETWKEEQTSEAFRDVGKFTTLDAKLLSALTNILTGDLYGHRMSANMAKSSGASSVKTWKTSSTSAPAGAAPSDPALNLKAKVKPAKKAMPKPKLKVVDEGHGPRRQEFDTSKFRSAQDLVWIEPSNMVGVPERKVDPNPGEQHVLRQAPVDTGEDPCDPGAPQLSRSRRRDGLNDSYHVHL